MDTLPSGTVTFLFTDIEGSTRLLQQLGERYAGVLAEHQQLLRLAIDQHNGRLVDTQGDSFFAAFPRAVDALNAAAQSQCDLAAHDWPEGAALRVRMGLHTGEPQLSAAHYTGIDVHRAARIAAAAHGGQVLLSQTTFDLVESDLPEGLALRDLGEHRLKDLRRPKHLYQLLIAGQPSDFPHIKTLDALPNNLPIQLTSFIGRELELKALGSMLEASRLLTLTGVGGTGKTRLALQAAAEALDGFRDGAWLVELAPLSDPALVPQAVAIALELREQAGRSFMDTFKDYLSRKELLLVLDNCEHLVEACAELADTLLHAAPGLKILATSREALGISGEATFPVRSLSLPRLEHPTPESIGPYEAVRLFIDRAQAVQPDFQVTSQNAPAVAQVCARLDGIPLAIELAAARVKGLGIDQIAARLDDRFRLLTGGSRTALPRQRTLQATIDWSYRLLSEEERLLLRQLSVFPAGGGWTLEAAEQVCQGGDVMDLLLRLVDKSLVVADTETGEPRYHMLETIRQYAQEKLDDAGEADAARDRHLEYFHLLAAQASPHLKSARQLEWLERLDVEHDNLRLALGWAQAGGSVLKGLALVTDLEMFWIYRAYIHEPVPVIENLLGRQLPSGSAALAALAHQIAATLQLFQRNMAAARAHALESERLLMQLGPAGNSRLAEVRGLFLEIDAETGPDPSRQRRAYKQVLELAKGSGNSWYEAHAIKNLGMTYRRSGDFREVRQLLEQSLAIFTRCGDGLRASEQDMTLGILAFEEGDYAEARLRLQAAVAFFRRARFNIQLDTPLWMLGVLSLREGDLPQAVAWYTECLQCDMQLGIDNQVAECLLGFARIAGLQGKPQRAAQLLGAAQAELERRHLPLETFDEADLQELDALLRHELGEAVFETNAGRGRILSLDQAAAFCLEEATSD
jgi:predicted ATPase/class 3 adenylate cyclase